MSPRRRILLIQLPIPQPGMDPAEGNVPLAAGYLKLLARLRGLDEAYEIEILPAHLANRLSDRGRTCFTNREISSDRSMFHR